MSDPQTTGRAPSRLVRSIRRVATSSGRRWWIGAAALIFLAFAVLGRDDLALMVRSFAHADWRWAVAAIALMLASLALRSLSLQLIVDAVAGVRSRFTDSFSATSIGLLANSLIPVRVGTVLSPYVLYVLLRRRREHLPFPTALGITLTERMFAIVTFLVMALVFLSTLSAPSWAVHVLYVSAGLIAVPLVGGFILNRRRRQVAEACERGGPRVQRMGRWLPQLIQSQRIWDRPLAAVAVSGTQVLAWIVQLAAAVAMLWAFHLGAAGLSGAALVIVLTNLISLVPATPGNVGNVPGGRRGGPRHLRRRRRPGAGLRARPAGAAARRRHRRRARGHERPGHDARRARRAQQEGGGRAARRRAEGPGGGESGRSLSLPSPPPA